jgi:phytoene dehydrogenase-like protein
MARFARRAMYSARSLADRTFRGARAKALFAGMCAHSFLSLEQVPSAAFGLMLGMLGHALGWPIPRGGAQRVTDALASYFRACGGRTFTSHNVRTLSDLPAARTVLMDVSPRGLARIGGGWLPRLYRRQLEAYRYGPGVFKIDWALDAPIPWRAEACRRAGTVHVGGTFDEIAAGERAVSQGEHPEEPFVLVAQQSLFDPTRAPTDKHTGWAYCHVPNGSKVDMTERIERQVERFAPSFRKIILARHTRTAAQMEVYNPNFVGGDVNGGLADIRQMFTRPVVRHDLYGTPLEGLFICSAATPPGGGVHGMCGYNAARVAIRQRTAAQPIMQPA